jgi:two-component system LytT family sensor kinase
MAILMDGLHASHVTGNLIAYSTALLIAVLLLALTLRAARLPGTPLANIAFACCGVLWIGGGLTQTALGAAGFRTFIPRAIQYTAALGVLVPVLAAWGAKRVAQVASVASAILAVLVWSRAIPLTGLKPYIAYYGAVVLAIGFATSVRRATTPRGVYYPSLVVALAGISAAVLVSVRLGSTAFFLLSHLILFAVLCGFYLFARFRYADVFVRYAVRIALAGTLAASLLSIAESRVLSHMVPDQVSAASFHVFAMVFLANTVLLALTFLDDAISRKLIGWLFRAPDRSEARRLGARLSQLQLEAEIAEAVADAARRSLDLASARLEKAEGTTALDGEVVEMDLETLIPVYSAGSVSHILRVSPGPTRPALVSRDLLHLRDIATLCGNRLDALAREREAVERQSREALLLQQVTEAELRALRAQVNPHFLFNSLNTIADLTVRDPARAETMTVRLAGVFRHVLAHSARPLTTVRDELEFLRTYLYIEEARFGDRLKVSIAASPEAEAEQIPSLILQPLVENALKHGLGPKTGPGSLRVRAEVDGSEIHLVVEDDGLGPRATWETKGVGLSNVGERLRTLYRERASVVLEARDDGGARATVRIPRNAV